MALDVGRWLKYAQAKLNSAARAGHDELDQLEAERKVELAEKPWLASDSEAPTFDEARARIEYESKEQRRRAEAEVDAVGSPEDALERAAAPPDPEVVKARLELDRRAIESKERLEAIRKELGVDPVDPPPG